MACGDPHSRIGAIYGSRVLFWGIVCKTFQEQLDGTVVVAPSPSKFDFNRPSPVSSKFWLPKILSWKKWNVKWGRWRNFVHFAHVGLRHLQAHWLFRVYLCGKVFSLLNRWRNHLWAEPCTFNLEVKLWTMGLCMMNYLHVPLTHVFIFRTYCSTHPWPSLTVPICEW